MVSAGLEGLKGLFLCCNFLSSKQTPHKFGHSKGSYQMVRKITKTLGVTVSERSVLLGVRQSPEMNC